MTTIIIAYGPRYTLITGPRRSGKTHEAIRLARESGKRPVAVLADAASEAEFPGIAVVWAKDKPAPQPGEIYIISDVMRMTGVECLHALALGIEADLIFVASAPQTDWHAALLDLLRKQCAVVAMASDDLGDSAAKREQPARVEVHRNHTKDCPARTAEDMAWVESLWTGTRSPKKPIEGPRPKPIGCEGCICGGRKLQELKKLLGAGSRFAVGQKVAHEDRVGIVQETSPSLGAFVRFENGDALWLPEQELTSVPKFAVGDWVTWEFDRVCGHHESDFEIQQRWFNRVWSYRHPDGREVHEHELKAQVPQHQYDSKGSVFLGRDGYSDLYYDERAHGCAVLIEVALGTVWIRDAKLPGPNGIEARRRAVARGLIK